MDVLTRLKPLVLLSGTNAEGVCTKVVTLSLDKVGGQGLGPVAVKERQGGGVGRNGDTPEDGLGDDSPPSGLSLSERLEEEGAGQQVLKLRVLAVGGSDVGQEDRLFGRSAFFAFLCTRYPSLINSP